MTTIKLYADDQHLKVIELTKLASGNKGSVALQVKLSPEWDGYTHSAVFFTEEKADDLYEVLLTEGRCTIPHEVLADAGELVIGIRGVSPDAVKVSDLIKYKVVDGAPAGTATTIGPTPDVYQQILAKLEELEQGNSGEVDSEEVERIVEESLGIINLYICSEGEYAEGGSPTIDMPEENTAYLVPQDDEGIQYASWVYVNGAWEFVDTLTVTLDETEGGKGLSAYEIAIENDFEGTEQEWLESLRGKDGAAGYTPVKGTDYFTDADKTEIINAIFAQVIDGNEVAY